MVDTNTRNMAYAGIGVFAASIIAFMAYQASVDPDISDDEEERPKARRAAMQRSVGPREEEKKKEEDKLGEQYTLEKLLEVLEVLDAETTAGYVRNFFKMKSDAAKDTRNTNGKIKRQERQKMEQETIRLVRSHLKDIIDNYCLETGFMSFCPDSADFMKKDRLTMPNYHAWLQKFKTDEKVVEIKERHNDYHKQIFELEGDDGYDRQPTLEPIDYSGKFPEELTEEVYLYIYRQTMAILRHDLFKEIMDSRKKMGRLDAEQHSALF